MAKVGYARASLVVWSPDAQQLSATQSKRANMLQKSLIVATLAVLAASPIAAETTSGNAGRMTFYTGYGAVANKGSTLERKWVVVNDPNLPVQISKYKGIKPLYSDQQWTYDATYWIDVTDSIAAFEVRIIPFDIWGERDTTLTATDITDLEAGVESRKFSGKWRILSDTTALEHYASLAYVARVRLQSGKILRADTDPILEQARNFAEDFSIGDLELGSEE